MFYNSELFKSESVLIERVSITRSTGRMFMLPVIEAEALNIVVCGPCWKYGWTDMLSFKYLSMAFRKSGKPGQDVYLILFGEESFETNFYCVFRFCHGRLYFVSECL